MLETVKDMAPMGRARLALRHARATGRRACTRAAPATALWVALVAPGVALAVVADQPRAAANQAGQPPIAHTATDYGIGHAVDAADVVAWNIDVSPDGKGLPAGSGDVASGRKVFASKCAACHGATGEGGLGDRLVGGMGSLTSAQPVKTVGSYWPYATTLFDYIRRAMPYNAPQSLSPGDVYAVSAFLLNANGIVPDGTRLDARTLPKVKMPNRDGFVVDSR
jgi:cytochrome c